LAVVPTTTQRTPAAPTTGVPTEVVVAATEVVVAATDVDVVPGAAVPPLDAGAGVVTVEVVGRAPLPVAVPRRQSTPFR
jgi:hypothetical protein